MGLAVIALLLVIHLFLPVKTESLQDSLFPGLKGEIELIVDAFNREVYGQVTIDQKTLSILRSALRHMKRLRYWPLRIKLWIFQ